MPEIRIGTSDYSFQDWKGPFYPEIVKVHKQVTHQRTNIEISMESLFTALEPIAQSRRLKVFLTQFPYSFKHSEQSRKHLIHLSVFTKVIQRHGGTSRRVIGTIIYILQNNYPNGKAT